MAKKAVKSKATRKPTAKQTPKRKNTKRLTDEYASVARKNEQRRGDELTELEPVGRKRTEMARRGK
jgi:hypothetical protein